MHGMDCRLFHISCPVMLCAYRNLPPSIQSALQYSGGVAITSEERREGRYRRRIEARRAKKETVYCDADRFETVFSYSHLYRSYRKCRLGVSWKASTQRYIAKAPLHVYHTLRQLQNGTFRSRGFSEFDIMERGKRRHIQSVDIYERVVQRCLCDYALVPLLRRTFIYDNGASMKGKGYSFAVNRLCRHLRRHYRKYGQEGYILLFDFSKFFENVRHEIIKRLLRKEISDTRIRELTEYFLDCFGDIGLGLGSQISQVLALASANKLDHYIKEVLWVECYGRYMDDGYLIHPSKDFLQKSLRAIEAICVQLGIKLNRRKTQIVKLSHGFTYLKVRFYLTARGKVVRKLGKGNVVRMRRKLKALRRMVDFGILTEDNVYDAFQSWRAHASHFHAYRTIQNMEGLWNKLGFRKNLKSTGGDIRGRRIYFSSGA